METDTDEVTRDWIRKYLSAPEMRRLLEDAIGAHLLAHTDCRLEPTLALERAQKIREFVLEQPERITVTAASGKYAGTRDLVGVSLMTCESGHEIRFNVGMTMSPIGEIPIRITHGTKSVRGKAWEAIRKLRAKQLREETQQARARAATMRV